MKKSLFADLNLLMVAFVWGATFVMVQNAIALLPPFTFNAVRFLMAAFILVCALVYCKQHRSILSYPLIKKGILLGVFLFAGYALQTVGLVYTTAGKAGFLTGLSIAFVPLFAVLLLRQRLRFNAVIGVMISLLGLYCLTMVDSATINQGDVMVLACAVAFALHVVMMSRYSPRFDPLPLTCVQIITVAVLNTVFAGVFEPWQTAFDLSVVLNYDVVTALVITAVFATAFAFFIQTTLQKHTSPTKVALIFAMEPVFAAITAYFWANETLGIMALVGCSLIFFGMIFAELPDNILPILRSSKSLTK